MPDPTLVETVGASNANSYVSRAEADTHFDERTDIADWTGAAVADKDRALISATRRIDQEQFRGVPVNPLAGTSTGTVQALKWPRNGAANDEGWTYLNTVIPEPVKRATMELALEILGGGVEFVDTGLEGFDGVEVGPLSVTPRHSRKAGALPAHIRRYLRPVLESPSTLQFEMARA